MLSHEYANQKLFYVINYLSVYAYLFFRDKNLNKVSVVIFIRWFYIWIYLQNLQNVRLFKILNPFPILCHSICQNLSVLFLHMP